MIQIDIKMPKCCDECFALDDHGDYPFCLISQDQRGYTFNTKEKRMPTCPLKAQEPVKPLKMAIDHVRKEPVVFSYECPVCMCGLQRHWVACPICGTKAKWDG